jgi:dipeptidyl-peptidase-4
LRVGAAGGESNCAAKKSAPGRSAILYQMRSPISIVAVAALLTLIPDEGRASDQLDRYLRQIFDSKDLQAKSFGPARWIEGGAAYTIVEAGEIARYDTASGKRSVLIPAKALTPAGGAGALQIDDYQWSKDATQLLIFTNAQKVWRDNTRGDYWVLNRTSGALKKLGADSPASSLLFAKFSPDGSHVAYVRTNNIYVEDLKSGDVRALTNNGSAILINGTSDWVYEEELSLRDCIRWSPDSRHIAYWQFDTSGVQQFTLIDNTSELYPKTMVIPYPKVGTTNSAVRIGVVSTAGGDTRWMDIPGDPRQNYLFRMEWAGNSDEIVVGQLNRLQNHLSIYLSGASTGSTKLFFEDKDAAWVDVREGGFDWLNRGKELLWLSERDGWLHAYLAPRSGGEPRLITTAKSDVIGIAHVDPESKYVYYNASPDDPTGSYLYRTDRSERITPSSQPGTHGYDIAPDCKWAFHTYSRFDQPPVTELISLPEHHSIRVLQDNLDLKKESAELLTATIEFLQIRLEDGTAIDGSLIKPPDFDPKKKYPLIVSVYGEPAGVTVVDRWSGRNGLFHRALAADGYLIASFDNRGTPAPKGRKWRKAVYGLVGDLSSKEQAEALRKLIAQRAYIDASRIGVWGWSGGGTNTLNLMFRSPELYQVGVAVAPVPDQRLYDTIYQERYMGLPDQNEEGYKKGSAINFAAGLKGKLLIVHGSGDDNVHFQGTERLVNKLIELDKPFDFMEYPNRTHGISEGKGTSLHVYQLIARYFEEHLSPGGR